MKSLSLTYFITLILFTIISCGRFGHGQHDLEDKPDTLHVVTLYGPTSFFDYRGDTLGMDYENVKRFAEEEGYVLAIHVASGISELIDRLKTGKSELGAYPVPFISEYNSDLIYCGPRELTWQLLVQKDSLGKVTDVTELIGKEISVEKDSKFHYRLQNLNEELGGGINIKIIESDTLTGDDLMRMVNEGTLPYTIIDNEMALLHESEFPGLDVSLKISLEQASSWVVAPGLDSLANKIDIWEKRTHDLPVVRELYKRYYDKGKFSEDNADLVNFKRQYPLTVGVITPYDQLFKKYASDADMDWEWLLAIAYCESRLHPEIRSRFGATGIMQVMPSSAAAVGIDPSLLTVPEYNIKAASKILSRMNSSLIKLIPDPEERMKFLLASYNSGLGHVFDSIALANEAGLDNSKWLGNVSVAMLMKSRPEFYNSPVVKHGYFRGRETVDFVEKVVAIYNYLKSNN